MSVSDRPRLYWVPQRDVETYWQLGRYWIEQACKRGPCGVSPQSLLRSCIEGGSQYFVVMKGDECIAAVITTVVIESNGRKVLEWTALGGRDREDWFGLESVVIEAAREHGCDAMRSYSRPGMKRALEPRGYRVKGYILEKEIV